MKAETKRLLGEIGVQLDQGHFPAVFDGGFVRPCKTGVHFETQGQETENVGTGSTRSAARPGSWAAGREGATGQPWTARAAPPVVSAELRRRYEAGLNDFVHAYPGARVWASENEMWLLVESAVVTGLERVATFIIRLPFSYPVHLPYLRLREVKAWAFWSTAVSQTWIGPRHTNFPDGSVCAFEPGDRTWLPGGSITTLVDLYTLWTARHLHLEIFGRWPGYQSVPFAAERIIELRDDEFCGCDNSGALYRDCCRPHDIENIDTEKFLAFWLNGLQSGRRRPPPEIVRFAWAKDNPPARDSDLRELKIAHASVAAE